MCYILHTRCSIRYSIVKFSMLFSRRGVEYKSYIVYRMLCVAYCIMYDSVLYRVIQQYIIQLYITSRVSSVILWSLVMYHVALYAHTTHGSIHELAIRHLCLWYIAVHGVISINIMLWFAISNTIILPYVMLCYTVLYFIGLCCM